MDIILSIEEQVSLAKQALEDKKGKDIKTYDLRHKSSLADYFIVASASSLPQIKTLADEVEGRLEQEAAGLRPAHVEGRDSGHWVLLDYHDFVVHLFLDKDREYYSLDKLWDRP
ncbi:ribosome silencing factor [Oscillospiraceae bacterium HV4-5-C5C]|nr:ribosome silencing factor [Oscillospiraceae bacterium HV4-5-C5C]